MDSPACTALSTWTVVSDGAKNLGGNKHTFKTLDLWLNLVTQRYLDMSGIRSSFLFLSFHVSLGYVPEKLAADECKLFSILCWDLILHFIHIHAFRAIFVLYYLLQFRCLFSYADKQDSEVSLAGFCAQKPRGA